MGVPNWGAAGPGSGLSEEPTSGVRSVTPDSSVVPECPPGPVISLVAAIPSGGWHGEVPLCVGR
jgi:hypothetical protein